MSIKLYSHRSAYIIQYTFIISIYIYISRWFCVKCNNVSDYKSVRWVWVGLITWKCPIIIRLWVDSHFISSWHSIQYYICMYAANRKWCGRFMKSQKSDIYWTNECSKKKNTTKLFNTPIFKWNKIKGNFLIEWPKYVYHIS